MSLEIWFKCKVYANRKPLVSEGVHFFAKDGCRVDRSIPDSRMTEVQRYLEGEETVNSEAKRYLADVNTRVIDEFHLTEDGDEMKIFCPVCEKRYTVTKEEYDKTYQKFLEGY